MPPKTSESDVISQKADSSFSAGSSVSSTPGVLVLPVVSGRGVWDLEGELDVGSDSNSL